MRKLSFAIAVMASVLSLPSVQTVAQTPLERDDRHTATLISPYYFGPNAFPVPDMSELTKEQLKAEIEKGFDDVSAGRVTPAADVFAELREEYRV